MRRFPRQSPTHRCSRLPIAMMLYQRGNNWNRFRARQYAHFARKWREVNDEEAFLQALAEAQRYRNAARKIESMDD